ncbi:MAG: response regulator [Alphaproteobacteria bacterium]|nr:response regulator [Alphaproteobacteria bacterium]
MHTLKILIIDDNIQGHESLRRAFSSVNQQPAFTLVDTAQEGLKRLQEQKFDCVFLSGALAKGGSAYFLQEACAGGHGLAPAPIVMLMRHGREQAVIESIRCGAQDYLVRSNITPDTVHIALSQAMEIYDLKRRHKEAQEQLFQVQKLDAVGQLTGGIAHDFNNLLTVILGNARLLRKMMQDSDDDSARKLRLETIETTARRGADLVRRLMVFSRQQSFDSKIVDINEVISQLTTLLTHTIGETIFIKTLMEGDLWLANIDVSQFENVIVNMAVNARDAMPKGGKLLIETQNVFIEEDFKEKYPDILPGPYVMVAISDSGQGMEPEVAARIFEPFFTTKEVGSGTGLGLSMAYGFARESGGFIHVYSERGMGTVFRIYLPRAKHSSQIAPPPVEDSRGEGEMILVVDDDERLRQMTCAMLGRMGYETCAAANGEAALAMLDDQSLRIDAVLTDISMQGGMNGVDLAINLETLRPGIGILFMTGFSENALSLSGLHKKYGIIGKPFRRDVLARRLHEALGQSARAPQEDEEVKTAPLNDNKEKKSHVQP